jgi:hypothetical protein
LRLRFFGLLAVILCSLLPATTEAASASVIYGANRLGEVVRLDLTAGTSAVVGQLLFGTQAMDQDPATGLVYYYELGKTGDDFATWDPVTGTSRVVRHYARAPRFYAKRMAFAPDGRLWLMDESDRLYRIDKVNGNLTALGKVSGLVTGSLGGTGDMAFAPDGTLYLVTYRNLYTVDIATRIATLRYSGLISAGPGIHVFAGLAFCDGQLFANDIDESILGSNLWRITPSTGSIVPLGPTASWMNDLTSCPATPAG